MIYSTCMAVASGQKLHTVAPFMIGSAASYNLSSYRLCTPLADYHSAEFCTIPGRNSQYTYPQSIPGVQDTIDLFAVEILTFTLETLDPQAPPECVDASIHVACLYLVPPCDPDLDLRLPICKRSCEAIVRLRAEGTCVKLDAFINDLSESSVALRPLRDVYFSFDCRNVSTYDAYEGTLNFTQNGECTSIISPAYEGQTKLKNFVTFHA